MFVLLLAASAFFTCASGHIAAWHKGMFCLDGADGTKNMNTNDAVQPLEDLTRTDWWFHHSNSCDLFPPAAGDFLELPAGGIFTVELAENRGQTTLSFNGQQTSDWPNGKTYPASGPPGEPTEEQCINDPNIHTQNESMAAGTIFAISYQSEIAQVTPTNLVVFSVRYNTPWKRVVKYDVPREMPECPAAGCICAWGWVPNGCGAESMYMEGFRCKVVYPTTPPAEPPRILAVARPPVWCEDDPVGCTKGAKQMVFWSQLDGNNVALNGTDLSGRPKSPGYNAKMGFLDGAQNDIFVSAP